MSNRKPSGFGDLDLSGVDASPRARPSAAEIDRRSSMPRRDPAPERELRDNVNIGGPASVIGRFKAEAKENGGQWQYLQALMDHWERR